MLGNWPLHELPNLTDDNCDVTSSQTPRYNCIAWAAGNDRRWWWPDPQDIGYWPEGAPREQSIDAFVKAFETLGYALCMDPSLQVGIEKIAIYGVKNPDGTTLPTHASLQLASGKWTSKLGPLEDISHSHADSVTGPVYGKVVCFMSRRRPTPEPTNS